MSLSVALASDHAGFELKQSLLTYLKAQGVVVSDLGTHSKAPVDYPDFAEKLGVFLCEGKAERGILICGSGVGASVAANKIAGIRAGLCHDTYSAHQGVEHDAINVLVLGSRVIGEKVAEELVHSFLQARFSMEERHLLRLSKVADLEARFGQNLRAPSKAAVAEIVRSTEE